MFKKILAYFQKQEWKYLIPEEDKCVALLGISTDNGKLQCILDVDEEQNKFIFFSIFPVNAPQQLRSEMAEFLMRINYSLFLGSFEMDFSDGEIRFKTSLIYENVDVSEKVIEHFIKDNIISMDNNFELINDFVSEKFSIKEFIENFND